MNGAHVNLETFKEKQTPLHYAAKYNALASLKLLMNYKANITDRDHRGRTALYLAAENVRINPNIIQFSANFLGKCDLHTC